jgi:hypothetical protein
MHDQRSSTVAEGEDQVDAAILGLLLHPDAQRPWAEDEVAREVGDPLAVTDGLARLFGAGLVHRLEGFVFATRAAVRGEQLAH